MIGKRTRAVLTGSVANLALPASSLITAPLLARALGASDRGDFAALTSPTLLIAVVGTLGLQDYLSQQLVGLRITNRGGLAILRKCIRPLTLWNIVLVAVFTSVYVLSGGSPALAAVFLLTVGSVAVGTSLAQGLAIGLGLFWIANLNRITIAVVRTIALVGTFIVDALTLEVALAIFAVAQIAGLVVMMFALRRSAFGQKSGAGTLAGPDIVHPLRPALRLLVGASLAVALVKLDQSIAYPVVGPAELGIYAVAVAVFEAPSAVSAAIRMVVLGDRSVSYLDYRVLARAMSIAFGVGALIGLVGAGAAPFLIPALFGEAFRGAVPATIVLMGALPFSFVLAIGSGMAIRLGRARLQSVAYGTALAVNIVGLLAWGPAGGALSMSWATASACLVGGVVIAGGLFAGSLRTPTPDPGAGNHVRMRSA